MNWGIYTEDKIGIFATILLAARYANTSGPASDEIVKKMVSQAALIVETAEVEYKALQQRAINRRDV